MAIGQVFFPSTSVLSCQYRYSNVSYSFTHQRVYITLATDSILKSPHEFVYYIHLAQNRNQQQAVEFVFLYFIVWLRHCCCTSLCDWGTVAVLHCVTEALLLYFIVWLRHCCCTSQPALCSMILLLASFHVYKLWVVLILCIGNCMISWRQIRFSKTDSAHIESASSYTYFVYFALCPTIFLKCENKYLRSFLFIL